MNEERDNLSTCKDSARGQAAMEKNESKTEQGCYRIEKLNGLCMPVDAKYTSFKAAVICSVFQIKEEKKKDQESKTADWESPSGFQGIWDFLVLFIGRSLRKNLGC